MTGKKFLHNESDGSVLSQLWERVRSFKSLLALVILAAVVGNGFVLLAPWLTGLAIDKMAGPGIVDWNGLLRLLVLFLMTAMAQRAAKAAP
jgi:ABC-type multidrug transport system fused ATPase/permease subunit